ncbi:zinc ribbon domain-containing protein [Youngiibacter multivorans]|uniref:Zinc-ribbon domain-containing protein n=1 Tax=Youngiibacter multivorans TaxID=937251 RepID=A0ABS4G8S0_9CLOT|nr:zinc ribbon domain-containing protein [Youngiibacter multivorans]MBP1920675.1 hypothetical protein [Youngiibacter multivorans]
MYCESCGKQIPDDSRFCEFCGNPVKDDSNQGLYNDSNLGLYNDADLGPGNDASEGPSKDVIEEAKEEVNEGYKSSKKKDRTIKEVRKTSDSGYGSYSKPRARIRVLPIILVVLIAACGYAAVKALGGDGIPRISDIPGIILGKDASDKEITREDFSWYVAASYDEVPEGGAALAYKDILGQWKVMAVNYVSEPEETFFSTAVLKENSLKDEGKTLNTAVEFTHHYVEFDGEKSEFEGDEAKDLLYANFEDGYLSLALGDDRLAEIIFWEKDGKEYGQSHIYSDWDKDGIADLINVLLFVR